MEEARSRIIYLESSIKHSQDCIKDEEYHIKECQFIIKNIQEQCEHEFETIGTHGCHVIECTKCGYTTGG